MPKGSAAMGSVLPRENSGVDAVPCRILTQSTGSRCDFTLGLLPSFDDCSARTTPSCMSAVLTAASPEVFRNARRLGPFFISTRNAFLEVALYQDRLIGRRLHIGALCMIPRSRRQTWATHSWFWV